MTKLPDNLPLNLCEFRSIEDAYLTGFQKVAVTLTELGKAMAAARKAGLVSSVAGDMGPAITSRNSAKQLARNFAGLNKLLATDNGIGKILWGKRPNAGFSGYIKRKPTMLSLMPKRLSGLFTRVLSNSQQRRALDGVVFNHELGEAAVPLSVLKHTTPTTPLEMAEHFIGASKSPYYFGGHNAPSVILREHNMLSSFTGMPRRDISVLRNLYRAKRTYDSTLPKLTSLMGESFDFGVSPRLSRHALRRINEIWLARVAKG